MKPLDARAAGTIDKGGYSFSFGDRLRRVVWMLAWTLLARWTPPPMNRWRCAILRLFGASIGTGCRVYASARIWYPANLTMDDLAWIGPRVICYNQGHITVGRRVTISQGAHLCASSHDVNDYYFQLLLRPIVIEPMAWIAAEAFVGPGVRIGEGAVLGARGVALKSLEPWTVYSGNPAAALRARALRNAGEDGEPNEI